MATRLIRNIKYGKRLFCSKVNNSAVNRLKQCELELKELQNRLERYFIAHRYPQPPQLDDASRKLKQINFELSDIIQSVEDNRDYNTVDQEK